MGVICTYKIAQYWKSSVVKLFITGEYSILHWFKQSAIQ